MLYAQQTTPHRTMRCLYKLINYAAISSKPEAELIEHLRSFTGGVAAGTLRVRAHISKFISSFHLPPVVGDEKNTKYKTHSKLGEREDSIQGTVNL